MVLCCVVGLGFRFNGNKEDLILSWPFQCPGTCNIYPLNLRLSSAIALMHKRLEARNGGHEMVEPHFEYVRIGNVYSPQTPSGQQDWAEVEENLWIM